MVTRPRACAFPDPGAMLGLPAALAVASLLGAHPVVDSTHGTVRTDSFPSRALGVEKALVVYLPPSYGREPRRRYPVAYYLHGLWGDETNWTALGHLDAAMDSLVARGMPEMIVVMPDGDDGWYTTWQTSPDRARCAADTTRKEPARSYCVARARYDDYVARDVVTYVDAHYRTIADRAARGIAGLSMGGYGAVTLALAHPEVFATAASHSGVLAPLYAGPHPFDGAARWPATPDSLRRPYGGIFPSLARAFGADTSGWWRRDPGRAAARTAAQARTPIPALFVDVGVGDAFVDQARAFRAEAARLGIPVTYAEWPGAHSWAYWSAHVGESLAWTAARLTESHP